MLNRKEDAVKVVRKGISTVPLRVLPVDDFSYILNLFCFEVGDNALAEQLLKEQAEELERWINYLLKFDVSKSKEISDELSYKYYLYQQLTSMALKYVPSLGNEMKAKYE